MRRLFTSESVTEGHPDKMADQISDAVLDAMMAQDPYSRVAAETMVATGMALVAGEVTTKAVVDIPSVVKETIRGIGYVGAGGGGYDADSVGVLVSLHAQSADIALGVDRSYESKASGGAGGFTTGAGDQGIIFGYATNETPEYMPTAISYAHKLSGRLSQVRKDGLLTYLRPDGKSQVTVEYGEGNAVKRVDTVVVSSQHSDEVGIERLREDVLRHVIRECIPAGLMDEGTKFYINPTGRFVIGGPLGDVGLTGRKIIVDSYGGAGRHGGGAFSGKDPTKVDRSAAYAARWVAKNLVAAGVADKLEIGLAYAIGVASPVSVAVETFGTGRLGDEAIMRIIGKAFDLRPDAIIEALGLRRPIYQKTASYGHFGRPDVGFTWELLDKADEIKAMM
ncbi:MAG: methionine adenosyltransferase [Oscillospiraceae bacterium]|nr:methionine adenosyltransferase [Oscillospiraceae bacterium]